MMGKWDSPPDNYRDQKGGTGDFYPNPNFIPIRVIKRIHISCFEQVELKYF